MNYRRERAPFIATEQCLTSNCMVKTNKLRNQLVVLASICYCE